MCESNQEVKDREKDRKNDPTEPMMAAKISDAATPTDGGVS